MNNLSNLVNKFKFKLSHTDYQHKEMEGPTEIGLDYFDKGTDGKVEFTHSLLSESGGVVGLDFGASRFSQVTKPYEPNNKRHNFGFYALERFAMGNHKITMGLRHDYQEYDANAFTSDDGAPTDGGAEGSTSFVATEKDFNVTSFSVGTTSKINDNWSLGFSAAHTERAPNHDELFVFGEHHATETIEHGDRNLKAERSNSIDVTLNWANQGNTFSMTPYFNDFSSFIALLDTGVVQFHDHGGESEALPVLLHQNVPAEFYGFEFQGNINLGANYAFNYRGDYVRAKNKDGGNLPRIPPLTLGSGLSYEWNTLQASVDVEHKFSQSDTVAGEFKTDDFTNLSLVVNYALPYVAGLNAFIKGDNLLDEERRDHTSFLKEKVLLGERSFMIGISGSF
jgi:iron complex outermembrane receptor protein